MPFLIIVGVLVLLGWMFASGKIVLRRKPKIKLNEECKKYYVECEKLLLPFYEEFRNIYDDILSEVEKKLDFAYQIYQKGDTTPLYQEIKGLFDISDEKKYIYWALCEVRSGLKERKGNLITAIQQEKYKKLYNDICSQCEKFEERIEFN